MVRLQDKVNHHNNGDQAVEKPVRILIIEDSEDDTVMLLRHLQQSGYLPVYEVVDSESEVEEALAAKKWDIIISDYVLPGFSGLDVLKLLADRELDTPCIITSGRITDEIAVAAMRAGAKDYIMKDNLKRIGPVVERELAEAVVRQRRRQAEKKVKERTTQLARANEQLKYYAQEVVRVQEEERKRIAYELHDDTAQYLSILKLQLNALVKSGKCQDPEVVEKLQFLEKDADRAFNDVRRYSHELRPVALEYGGLLAALEQVIEDINKLQQTKVNLKVEGGEPDLSDDVKLGLFRIAQEALNNIRKHAKASNATIKLHFEDSRVKLRVIDNGAGFNLKQALAKTGKTGSLGLMSMQERARLIGASLDITSKPGKGTTVTAEVKL